MRRAWWLLLHVSPLVGAACASAPDGSIGATLSGEIVDARGAPIQGATIWVGTSEGAWFWKWRDHDRWPPPNILGVTDATGRFTLSIADLGSSLRHDVWIIGERLVATAVSDREIVAASTHELGRIVIADGVTVEGTISREDGRPVADAEVSLRHRLEWPHPAAILGRASGRVVRTDAAGRYRFTAAPAGPVWITVTATGCALQVSGEHELTHAGPNVCDVHLEAGGEISGVVVSATGEPLAGALVAAVPCEAYLSHAEIRARCAADGRFEIRGARPMAFRVSAVADFHRAEQIEPVTIGTADLRFVLTRRAGVCLRVLSRDGAALDTYTVSVKSAQVDAPGPPWTVLRAKRVHRPPRGVAEVDTPDRGICWLQVEAPGHAPKLSDPLWIEPGGTAPDLIVRLDEGGAIHGTVRDENGAPIGGAVIETLQNEFDETQFGMLFREAMPHAIKRTSVVARADGAFRIALLNPETYCLKISRAERCDLLLRDLSVRAADTTQLGELVMRTGTTLAGIVRVAVPFVGRDEGIRIELRRIEDPDDAHAWPFHDQVMIGKDGRFVMPRQLGPGRYIIYANRWPNGMANFPFRHGEREIVIDGTQRRAWIEIDV